MAQIARKLPSEAKPRVVYNFSAAVVRKRVFAGRAASGKYVLLSRRPEKTFFFNFLYVSSHLQSFHEIKNSASYKRISFSVYLATLRYMFLRFKISESKFSWWNLKNFFFLILYWKIEIFSKYNELYRKTLIIR